MISSNGPAYLAGHADNVAKPANALLALELTLHACQRLTRTASALDRRNRHHHLPQWTRPLASVAARPDRGDTRVGRARKTPPRTERAVTADDVRRRFAATVAARHIPSARTIASKVHVHQTRAGDLRREIEATGRQPGVTDIAVWRSCGSAP